MSAGGCQRRLTACDTNTWDRYDIFNTIEEIFSNDIGVCGTHGQPLRQPRGGHHGRPPPSSSDRDNVARTQSEYSQNTDSVSNGWKTEIISSLPSYRHSHPRHCFRLYHHLGLQPAVPARAPHGVRAVRMLRQGVHTKVRARIPPLLLPTVLPLLSPLFLSLHLLSHPFAIFPPPVPPLPSL